jgi:hypothetical protein
MSILAELIVVADLVAAQGRSSRQHRVHVDRFAACEQLFPAAVDE